MAYPADKKVFVNINGEIFNKENAKISVFDRGLLFGDSVYEVTLAYGDKIVMLDEHLERLWNSAHGLFWTPSFSKETIAQEIKKSLVHAQFSISYLRIMLTRGEGAIGLDPTGIESNNLIIIVQEHMAHPEHYYTDGVVMAYADVERNNRKSLDPAIKTGNYLNNFLAYMNAKNKGAYEPILFNADQFVAEGATCNIWMVKNGVLKTPALQVGILAGITRAKVIELAQTLGIPVEEAWIRKEELECADEVFITSSTRMIIPVRKIEGITIGDKNKRPITMKLLAAYRKFVGL